MRKNLLFILIFLLLLSSCSDKKVISAFGYMNEKLEESNQALAIRNDVYQQLLNSQIDADPKKYQPTKDRVDRVDRITNDFYNYLDDLKNDIFSAHFENGEDRKQYEKLSSSDYIDGLFFNGEDASEEGKQFLARIDRFKRDIAKALGRGFGTISSLVNARFRTETIYDAKSKPIPWLNLKFKGFPAITSITNLSQMQTDVKLIQLELLNSMISGEFDRELAMRNFIGIVQLNKNAYLQGEKVSGKILLGRFDTSVTPENVIVNGIKVDDKFVREGEINLNFRAGGIGEHPLAGVFTVMEEGEPVQIRFNSTYSVIRKYRFEGSDPSNPNATNKTTVPEVPAFDETKVKLQGTLRGEFGYISVSKRTLSVSTIGALHYESNKKYKAVSFKMNIQGGSPLKVNGNKLDARAKKAITRLRRGQKVKIYDIKVVSSTGGRLNNIEPINIKIKN
jgi:gliding motility-associated protein GldM